MTRGARSRERAIALVVAVLLAGTSAIGGPPPTRATEPTPSAPPTEILGAETPAPATTPEPLPTSKPTAAPTPAATATPAPTPTPTPAPAASPGPPAATPAPAGDVPGLAPLPAGAVEVVAKRTESSRTYRDATGRTTTELYTEPVFYKPAGATDYLPVEVGFRASDDPRVSAISDRAPASVAVAPSTAEGGFLVLARGGQRIAFGLPAGAAKDARTVAPAVSGAVADYAGFLPGVDLRVIAGARGAKSFFIWRAVPKDPTASYVVDAPGLTLRPGPDGAIDLLDAGGATVARIPRPYAVDSTPDARTGSGRFTDKVSLSLAEDGRTVTVAVDPAWLATAVYPVYVDPSTGWVYNAGSDSYGDAHTASGYPTMNFADYVRPDSPYYHELWNGIDPSGTSGESKDFLRWNVSAVNGTTIDAATLAIYPYHQYYNAPTVENTSARQVVDDWSEDWITWNRQQQMSSPINEVTAGACVESDWCTWNLKTIVQNWATTSSSNYGVQIDTDGHGSTYWKRFIAAEQGSTARPKLTITYHVPTATAIAKPAFTGSRAFSWTYGGSPGQTKYQVQLSSDGGTTWPAGLDGGQVTSGAATWTAPDTMALADLTTYTWHVRVYDGFSWSAYSAASSFTFDAFRRGDEPYYTRVPFEAGGGWSLDVGVHSGEARLARSLFAIGAIGPPAALELTYNSSDVASAGLFGTGWSSNLTQRLWLNSPSSPTLIVWTRADGGRVAFTGSGGTWTPVPGHTEKLTYAGSPTNEYTVTQPDQTRLVFESTGAYRLKRIVDRFDKALAVTYPTNQIVATDAVSRATTLQLATFNGALRVDYATDAAGRTWDFAYDTSTGTDLQTITEPAPGGSAVTPVTSLTYDSSHRLTRVDLKRDGVAADKVTWKIGYDTNGKAISVVDPIAHADYADNPKHTFTYGTGSTVVDLRRTYVGPCDPTTNGNCNRTTYTFDAHGRVTAITDPGGFTTTQTWDAAWNLASVSRPITTTTSATTTYQYDGNGNVTSETQDLVEGTPRTTLVTKSWYNPATNDLLVRSESDSDTATKLVTKYEYGVHGELIKVIANCTSSGTTPPTPASTCSGGGTQDASTNLRTDFLYDAATGLLTLEWDALGRATKHEYDPVGNETAVIRNYTCSGTTLPTRAQTCTGTGTVDAQTNVRASSAYAGTIPTALGLATTQTDPVLNVTTNAYDNLGRRTTEILPGDTTSIPALTRTTGYDELGNTLTETEAWPAIPYVAGDSRATVRTYDLLNREKTLTPPIGPVTSTAYDAAGNATQTTADGITTTRVFDGLGRPTSETTGSATTLHGHDPQGRETSTTNPQGEVTTQTYDLAGRLLVQVVDPAGVAATTTHVYDSLGRETKAVDPAGIVSRTGYDRLGRACRTVEASTQNDTAWAALANACTSALPDPSTSTAYDKAGNAVSATAPDGTLTTTVFDPLDRPVTVIANDVANPTLPSQDVTTRTWYDAAGRTVAATDPAQIVTRTIFNPRGLPATVIENCTDDGTTPPSTASPSTCTGDPTPPLGTNISSTSTYDGTGALVVAVTAKGTGLPEATSRYAYDAAGRTLAVRDPLGTVTRTMYDSSGRVSRTIVNCTDDMSSPAPPPEASFWTCAASGTHDGTWNLETVTTYDARGNQASETAPNGRVTTYIYDTADRLVRRIDNDVTSPTLPTEDVTTEFAYDDAGRQVAVKSPTADAASYTVSTLAYDDAGRVTTETRNCTNSGAAPPADPAWKTCAGTGTQDRVTNLVTTYGYDARGNRSRVTAPAPSAAADTVATVTTRYAFDADNRLCRVVASSTQTDAQWDALANACTSAISGTTTTNVSTRYTYDGAGNLATMIDANGNTTTYGYDAPGRQTSLTDALGRTVTTGYDALGRRTSQTDRVGNVVSWTYDAASRVATRTAGGITTTSTYDDNGNRLTATASGGVTIETTYDRLNRPKTVTVSNDTGAATTYTYSLTNPSWTDPTGTHTATLDRFDRQVALDDPVTTGTWSWSYRADGQQASVTPPSGYGSATSSTYDAAGRLTGLATANASFTSTYNRAGNRLSENATVTGDPQNGTATFTFDPLGRLASYALPGIRTLAATWQADPNRDTLTTDGTPVSTTFDAADRPTSTGFANDLDGRLTAIPARGGAPAKSLAYDALGRLVSATVAGVLHTYAYDPLDRLVTVSENGTAVLRLRYVGQTGAVAQLLDGAWAVTRNVGTEWSGASLADWAPGPTGWRRYLANGHGDLVATLAANGAVSASLRLDPWGVPLRSVPTGYPSFGFQGSLTDRTTTLVYARARWYDPVLATFTSEDPLVGETADPPSRHLYAYGAGDPVDRADVSGLFGYRVRAGDALTQLGKRWYGSTARWTWIWNDNRKTIRRPDTLTVGSCLWIDNLTDPTDPNLSRCSTYRRTGRQDTDGNVVRALRRLNVQWRDLTWWRLLGITDREVGRARTPGSALAQKYAKNRAPFDDFGAYMYQLHDGMIVSREAGVRWVVAATGVPGNGLRGQTFGRWIFIDNMQNFHDDALRAHEYIHLLQAEAGGAGFSVSYGWEYLFHRQSGSNPHEAIAYLWQGFIDAYGRQAIGAFGDPQPWCVYKPLGGTAGGCW